MYDLIFYIIIALILIYTFANGVKDGPNAVATIIASRSIEPKKALYIAAFIELIAPFAVYVMGFSVAKTVSGLVNVTFVEDISSGVLFIGAAVLGAIIWNLLMLKFKMPSSSSHSLIGSIIGSGIIAYGITQINWINFLMKVILLMVATPILGFLVGYIIMKLIDFCTRHSHVSVNNFFIKSQIFGMAFLSFNHSLNDSQKSIGVAMLLTAICLGGGDSLPLWVVASTGVAISGGLFLGGFRIIKTVGEDIYRLRPKHSFSSQLSSSLVILVSTFLGAPVSTSQIVSSSIMGVGSAQKIKSVRWLVVKKILLSWVLTIPAAAVFGGSLYYLGSLIML